MRACVARPTTVVPTRRAPIDARACTSRSAPDGAATRSDPCCFATTMPRKPAALPAAGQKAATAAATTTTLTMPLFITRSFTRWIPAAAAAGFPLRGRSARKLAGRSSGADEAAELPLEPEQDGLEGE